MPLWLAVSIPGVLALSGIGVATVWIRRGN